MVKYIISDFTGFDNDENLYFIKVGIEGKRSMPLLYTVWGLTIEVTRERAELLVELLSEKAVNGS